MKVIVTDERRRPDAGSTRRFAVARMGSLDSVAPLARTTRPRCTARLASEPIRAIQGYSVP